MRPLSKDLRQRVIDAVEGGASRRAAAERFGVAPSTAVRWLDQWRSEGRVGPRPQGGDKRSHHIEAYSKEILGLVKANKDITLAEIAAHLFDEHGRVFGQTTIWRLLDRHAMTFKKNSTRRRAAKT